MTYDFVGLQDWLRDQCERHNLSWRDASIKANLNPGAISAIMSGVRPGLTVCTLLAAYFDASPEFVLRLAGHLPQREAIHPNLSPYAQDGLEQIARALTQFEKRQQEEIVINLLAVIRVLVAGQSDDAHYARELEAEVRKLREVDPDKAREVMQATIDQVQFHRALAEREAETAKEEKQGVGPA